MIYNTSTSDTMQGILEICATINSFIWEYLDVTTSKMSLCSLHFLSPNEIGTVESGKTLTLNLLACPSFLALSQNNFIFNIYWNFPSGDFFFPLL